MHGNDELTGVANIQSQLEQVCLIITDEPGRASIATHDLPFISLCGAHNTQPQRMLQSCPSTRVAVLLVASDILEYIIRRLW